MEEALNRLPNGPRLMAEELGIHRQHLEGWINGEYQVTAEILVRLEDWLKGVSK